eukprot:scaffold119540_cov66-Phaeocystis_antarctica.AAC.6
MAASAAPCARRARATDRGARRTCRARRGRVPHALPARGAARPHGDAVRRLGRGHQPRDPRADRERRGRAARRAGVRVVPRAGFHGARPGRWSCSTRACMAERVIESVAEWQHA